MGDDCPGKLRRGEHAAFDMHVPVAEARDHKSICAQNLSVRPDTMAGIRAYIGKAPVDDSNIPAQNFAGMNIGELAI